MFLLKDFRLSFDISVIFSLDERGKVVANVTGSISDSRVENLHGIASMEISHGRPT